MKYGGKLLVCLLGGFGLGTCAFNNLAASADVPTSPYEDIIARNAFALKPLPPPADPNELVKAPPVKITLTGITTIIGKRALLETPAPSGKAATPGGPSKLYYMLRVGEKEGDIEVVDIDERTGTVKVKNAGQEFTLSFEKDGSKLPNTPAPVGLPGALPGVTPPPGGYPMASPMKTAEAGMGGFPALPSRTVRTPNGGSGASTTQPGTFSGFANAGGMTPNVNASGVAMPSFASSTPLQTPPNLHETGMSTEEQMIMMETQRELTKNQGRLPPLPPTALTPPGSPGSLVGPGAGNTTTPGNPITTRPGLPPLPGLPGGN